jgi:3-dehydroquinate synthase
VSTAVGAGPTRTIRIGGHAYPLHLGGGLIDALGALWSPLAAGRGVLLVSDDGVDALAARAAASLEAAGLRVIRVGVPAGEASKSLGQVERICRAAAVEGLRRDDAVMAVGGGMVGDLAGFVAAAYQRGVRLVHVPTTLLAMVDSAIGGKTAVDLPEGKNYVGAFWQPELVVMDVTALETLPARELACGFAEVVKYALLRGSDMLARLRDRPPLPGPCEALTDLVLECVEQKAAVVASDEREAGPRATLNLGHTVGHGIEAATGYGDGYLHGEAVSLGLLAALRLSERHEGLHPAVREVTREILDRHGLPTRLRPDVGVDEVLAAMGRDKKAQAGALNMVLLAAPGRPLVRRSPPLPSVRAAIEELRG